MASSSPTSRRDAVFVAVLALLVLVGVVTALTRSGDSEQRRGDVGAVTGSHGDAGSAALSALRYRPGNDDEYAARAAAGFSHPLYARVPGGAPATADRVAGWRKLVEEAAGADGSPVDADTLEALVYLESAGLTDAAATGRARDAVGLTQIVAETGQSLLGMRIDVAQSDALTREIRRLEGRIRRWDARGSAGAARRGRQQLRVLKIDRATADPRYNPRRALAAAVRYLRFAEGRLGRLDLALTSYHMGVGNLQNVLAAYGRRQVPYAQLYFDVDPERSPRAYRMLSRFQDDSATYYWRMLAAKEIMRLHRDDPDELARRAQLATRKASREDLLHPADEAEIFDDTGAVKEAIESEDLIALPIDALNANGVAVSPAMGELAARLQAPRARYRALRRGSLATLVTIGAAVRKLGSRAPLIVTSTVRDTTYQRLLQGETREATHAYSLHTTGWAMDISRNYRSDRQAELFQFVLTRMQALDLITWVREPAAIHLTASPDSEQRLGPVLDIALGR